MNDPKTFTLNVNPGDILYLYRSDFNYRLFSYDNYPKIAFALLCLVLSVLSVLGMNYTKDYFFMILAFLCGMGYNSILLLSSYWGNRKKQAEVKTWIKSIQHYTSHSITLGESYIKYHRDNEVFLYEINEAKSIFHNSEYFYCQLQPGTNLVLPEKSFMKDEYKEFTEIIDRMIK